VCVSVITNVRYNSLLTFLSHSHCCQLAWMGWDNLNTSAKFQTNMPLCTKQNTTCITMNSPERQVKDRNSVKVTAKCEIPYSLIILEKIPLGRPRHTMWQDIKIILRECVWSCELHFTLAQPTSYKAYRGCYAADQLWYIKIKNSSKMSK
jgi:hypothetical protein